MHSTRKAPRSSTVHSRAIAAAALALALVLVLAGMASAAPVVTIDSGPDEGSATNDTMPVFGFSFDFTAIAVDCSIDQGTEDWQSCSGTYALATPLQPDGDWFFRVRASDGIDPPNIVTRSFTIDTVAPSLSIDSGPPALTNGRTPVVFTTDGSAECSVDDGASYRPCASPYALTSLADGDYTFRVFATDDAGNQTPEQVWGPFTVDATPPGARVTSGPDGPTNDTLPTFGFEADGDARSFECWIDSDSPVSCPGLTYTASRPLSDGAHTFRVRATDLAGNVGTAAVRSFIVDQDAPSLTIDSGPEGPTNVTTPSFQFTAEPGAVVQCSIDQAALPLGSCTSLTTYVLATPLSEGTHVFRVRAIDGVGNDHIESRDFTVDTTPPSLSIGFGPSGTTSDSTPLFSFSPEVAATVQCSIDQGTPAYGPCASAKTHAAVAPLADGAYVFRVLATDRAGNQTTATRAFTVDTVPDTAAPTPPSRSSRLLLLSPFPLVRISGTLTATGARIRLLSVRAPRGALVRVTVTPACSGKRPSSRRCRVLQASGTVGRHAVIGFRGLARAYRSGTVIVVRVWRADRIGKYTRFTIVRGKAPRRVDQCLLPGATRGSRCPSD